MVHFADRCPYVLEYVSTKYEDSCFYKYVAYRYRIYERRNFIFRSINVAEIRSGQGIDSGLSVQLETSGLGSQETRNGEKDKLRPVCPL
jgi:hypothetical protein